MICFIIPREGKFATVIDGKLIGTSKHKDYSVFHWKARDVQALKRVELTKFVFVDRTGKADEVIDCSALEGRGHNYVTAKRSTAELTADESLLMQAAINIAAGRPANHTEPVPENERLGEAGPASAETPDAPPAEPASAEPASAELPSTAAEALGNLDSAPASEAPSAMIGAGAGAGAGSTAASQESEPLPSPAAEIFEQAKAQHASRKMNKRQAAMARAKGRSA